MSVVWIAGMTRRCSLCGSEAPSVARQKLLERYDVTYFQCPRCDLLQTETPYWLEEAYASALSALDTGALQRNQICARLVLATHLVLALDPDRPSLDWGGGHGVLVRMLRDYGLDFRWFDRYAENLFARGFDGDPAARHALVAAFEVFEHLADVGDELERLFASRPDFVLVGTVLHAGHREGWWYYSLPSGQHIAFYSARTMAHIGERFGYEAIARPMYTLFIRNGVQLGTARRTLVAGLLGWPRLAYTVTSFVPDPVLFKLGPYRSRTQVDQASLLRRG
jgi:hypothetical protein